MGKLIQRALAEISRLPETDQDALAAILLEEIASERRWRETFERSQVVISALADEAIAQHRAGETDPLGLLLGDE